MSPEDLRRLPADQSELEARWPRVLAEILTEVRSPAAPEEVAAALGQDQDFLALVQGWDQRPTAAQARAWETILGRLRQAALASRPYCLRCGDCCRAGSPALYDQDRPTLAAGAIRREDLVTLRRGERAWSNQAQEVVVLERERVKLREAPESRTCLFLGPGGDACLIYPDRPHQCRVMECWDPSRFQTLLQDPPLTRADLLGRDNPLNPLLQTHEERCRPEALAEALAQVAPTDPASQTPALELILYDLHLREFVSQKFDLPLGEMDFFFGRPLLALCPAFGFKVEPDPEGQLRLTPLDAVPQPSPA